MRLDEGSGQRRIDEGTSWPLAKGNCRRTRFDIKTVLSAIHEGTIPALRIGRRIIVTKPVFDRMLETGRNQP
jgi:hypothetical protein